MDMRKFYYLSSALFMYCFMVSHAMIARNLTTDQQALLEFKHHIDDPHNILTNWTITTSFCNWVGVSCAAKHKRVTALNLPNMDLTGTIPPHLGNLSFLVSLNLSHNKFYGHLPREMEQLSRLKLIELSFNFLSGEIPSWFMKLNKVSYLNLRYNNLTGAIPRSLGNLTRLKKLIVDRNDLEGEIPWEIGNLQNLELFVAGDMRLVGPIPASIFNVSSLKAIYLNDNSLFGSIPDNMCSQDRLFKLEILQIMYNQFSGHIPSSIGDCSNLQILCLSFNHFGGLIPRRIGNLTELKEIYLGFNDLKGEIPLEIGNLVTLEELSIVSTSLNGPIPPSIFNMSYLKEINLSNNSLSGELPYVISTPNLEAINLWGNHLSGNIPDFFSNASNLRNIEFSENSFYGLIPNSLGNLRFLEELRLWANNLTIETSSHERSFLHSLANCKYLKYLELSWNPLNGIFLPSISNLSASLQYLRLHDCKIKGNIPMEIGSLHNLILLDLSSNELSGSIPATIGKLKNLQGLELDDNKLQGSLPPEVCGLKELYKLFLGANELNGTLPTCLGDLTALRTLFLSYNKFHSTIPSSFWTLKDILKVYLSSNYLSGSLPPDIGNLKVLTHLNLSRNLLSGYIPLTIGSLNDLQVLDFSGNRLQGPIPVSMGDLISLKSLDLSNNNLSGLIPKSLEKLSNLNYFNVSFNRLEGKIPTEGPFVNFTAKSFDRNYALCGLPRLQVPPCKNGTHKQSKKITMHALTCVLSVLASIITIAAFIIVYKIWHSRSTNLAIGEALVHVEKWRKVSYSQLSQATDGFSEYNLLGSGSFGTVYKGILSDGTNVAIKVFNLEIDGAFRSFDIECEVMRSILHRNLVKVITSCSNIDFKALVLEFMPNGSLEKWLYSYNYFLDILQRINIMIDVASTLEYLHLGHPIPIIHCDLKPSNVLLDKDMVAHVGDFGIAKLLGENDSVKQTMTLATIGYMAPEYGSTGIISVKSDVYSYGVLLMEIFTRKKPTDENFDGEMSMRQWVKMSLQSNGIIGVSDSNLVQKEEEYFVIKANCIASIMTLALDCSSELPEDRIDMKDVVSRLQNIKTKFLNKIEKD